jgi:hypothetical protein
LTAQSEEITHGRCRRPLVDDSVLEAGHDARSSFEVITTSFTAASMSSEVSVIVSSIEDL